MGRWKEAEKKEFTDWANGVFQSSWTSWRIRNLVDELSKGVLLLRLTESLVCRNIPIIHPEPTLASERAENVELAIEILKAESVELPGILSQDIAQRNEEVILALCCFLKRHFSPFGQQTEQHSSIPDLPPRNSNGLDAKRLTSSGEIDNAFYYVPFEKEDIAVLEWVSQLLGKYFEDYSVFQEGTILCILGNKIALRKIPKEIITNSSPLQKIQLALDHAKHELGIVTDLGPSDIIAGRQQNALRNYLLLLKRIHSNQMDSIRKEIESMKIKASNRQRLSSGGLKSRPHSSCYATLTPTQSQSYLSEIHHTYPEMIDFPKTTADTSCSRQSKTPPSVPVKYSRTCTDDFAATKLDSLVGTDKVAISSRRTQNRDWNIDITNLDLLYLGRKDTQTSNRKHVAISKNRNFDFYPSASDSNSLSASLGVCGMLNSTCIAEPLNDTEPLDTTNSILSSSRVSTAITVQESSDVELRRKKEILHNDLHTLRIKLADLRSKNNETIARLKATEETAQSSGLSLSKFRYINPPVKIKPLEQTQKQMHVNCNSNSPLNKEKGPSKTKGFDSNRNEKQKSCRNDQPLHYDNTKQQQHYRDMTESSFTSHTGIMDYSSTNPPNDFNSKIISNKESKPAYNSQTTPKKKSFQEYAQDVTNLVRLSSRSPRGSLEVE